MKALNILKSGLAIFLVAVLSTASIASNDPTSSTANTTLEDISVEAMKISVPADMNTYVTVIDQQGSMVYSDLIEKDENPGKTYDFSDVEKGVYTFKTSSEHKSVEKTFVVENNELRIIKEEISYLPVFWIDGDILSVSYMNATSEEVYISLDDATYLYYEEFGGSDMSYGKMLNIKNLTKGEYSISLKSGENTYTYFFDK